VSERRHQVLLGARWLAALALLVAALSTAWVRMCSGSPGVDYYQFWIVGRARAVLDLRDPYSDAARARMAELGRQLAREAVHATRRLQFCAYWRDTVETFGTPLLYAGVSAASTGDYDTDLRRFQTVSIAAFVCALAALCVLLGGGADVGLAVAALMCALSDPLASDVRTANVGELQLGGLALVLALSRRAEAIRVFAAGAALAALVALKPTLALVPLLLAVALLAERKLRLLAALVAGALAGALAAVARGNYSLAQWVSEMGGPRLGPFLTGGLAAAAAVSLWLGRFASSFERTFLAVALGAAIAVLGPQLAWLHYDVLLVPLLLFLLRPAAGAWRRAGALACAVALLGWPLRALAGLALDAPVYVFAGWSAVLLALVRTPRSSPRQSASVP